MMSVDHLHLMYVGQISGHFADESFNSFSTMNIVVFQFPVNLFPLVQLTRYPNIGLDNGLVPMRQQDIIRPNEGLVFTDASPRSVTWLLPSKFL